MRRTAVKKVFDFNVMKFGNGGLGAVNGMRPDGQVVRTTEQIQKVWVGTTFALAALLLQEGMNEEAYKAAWGVYDVRRVACPERRVCDAFRARTARGYHCCI